MRKIYKAIFIVCLGFIFAVFPEIAKAQLNINASVTQNVNCFDGGNGEVTLNITTGTAPFTVEFYLFNGSETPITTISNTNDNVFILNDNISIGSGSVSYTGPFPGFGIR